MKVIVYKGNINEVIKEMKEDIKNGKNKNMAHN